VLRYACFVSTNAVPTGTATFNASSQRIVGFSQGTALGGISLTAGASFDSQLSDTTRSYAGKGTVRYAW